MAVPIAAAMPYIASGAGAIFSALGQRNQNRENRAEAQRNRDFQKMMSDTAVSRRMRDMRRGGLNPILAGKFDASSPAGNMAVAGNIGAAGAEGAGRGATTALSISQRKNIQAQTRITNLNADVLEPPAAVARDVYAAGKFARKQVITRALPHLPSLGSGTAVDESRRTQFRTHNDAGLNAVALYAKEFPKADKKTLTKIYNDAVRRSQNRKY